LILVIFCSLLVISFIIFKKKNYSIIIVGLVIAFIYRCSENMNLLFKYELSISMVNRDVRKLLVSLTLLLFFLCFFKWWDDELITSTVLFLLLTLILIFTVNKIVWFYFLFESRVIPLFFMIIIRGYRPERYRAAVWIGVYTVGRSLPFLLLIVLYFFNINLYSPSSSSSSSSIISSIILLLPFLVKFPIFGLHYWLPIAHVEAPLVGRIILAGIILKLGGYGLLIIYSLFNVRFKVTSLICIWSILGFIYVCFNIIECRDIKKFIALRRVAHIRIRIIGILFNSSTRIFSSVSILFAHGLCSSIIFFLANSVYLISGSRALVLNKGVIIINPILCIWFFLFCSVNMAAPPRLRFLSEILLVPSIIYFFPKIIIIIIFRTLFLRAIYRIYLYYRVCHGKGLGLFIFSSCKSSIDNTLMFISLWWLLWSISILWIFGM